MFWIDKYEKEWRKKWMVVAKLTRYGPKDGWSERERESS